MVAMNLLRGTGRRAEYVITGAWGTKALAEAAKEGDAHAVWTGADGAFVTVPSAGELAGAVSAGAAYTHITTNETIQGVEFPTTRRHPRACRWSPTCRRTSAHGPWTWAATG